jgi:hypothetical protein
MEVTNESYKEVTLFSATVISHIFLLMFLMQTVQCCKMLRLSWMHVDHICQQFPALSCGPRTVAIRATAQN